MSTPWSMRAEFVDVAFPFHLLLAPDLTITAAGSSLSRLHRGELIGCHLSDRFVVETPRVEFTFEAFARHPRSLFLLRSSACPGLVLRGQMIDGVGDRGMLFVGSPWVTETSAFVELGLTLDDFAVSDAVVDYVLLLQNQSIALRQSEQLAEQLRESTAQLMHRATHDALTSLPNRALLFQQLEIALADRTEGVELSLLMMDLDGFKAVNDTFGHSAGDAVLELVAERLRAIARPGDLVARFGGDEFGIVVCTTPAQDTGVDSAIAERIHDSLRHPITLPEQWGTSVPMAASIGIARATGGESAEDLIRNADLAMYVAKSAGRGCSRTFSNDMHEIAARRMDLARQLRSALARNELRLVYQPVLRLASDRYAGAEALLRWAHPELGLLSPDAFLDIAEETGLIVPIGAWVLDQACRELSCWQQNHTGPEALGVAINLSGRQFSSTLVDDIRSAIRRYDLDPSTITLEITEGLIRDDAISTARTMDELKQLGVWLAIDDFGTGHSSLGRLRSFPFDELKIDRQFVNDLGTADPTLVVAQIAMAHGLGLNVVAEGVETPTQLEILRRYGCDQAQGYLIARPLEPHAIRRALTGMGVWSSSDTASWGDAARAS